MATTITAEAFTKLLALLDADRERAGERYEELRRTLMRFFQWRGAPFPEEQTDEVLNRVAQKVSAGIEIRNIGGYCHEVARLVCLEALKGHDSKRDSLDLTHHEVTHERLEEARERELRLHCLDGCLDVLPAESRQVIVDYYRADKVGHIEHRKALAARLGLQREALANRAQRLRDKLEHCVRACLRERTAI